MIIGALALSLAGFAAIGAPGAAAQRPLATGFFDGTFTSGDQAVRSQWLGRAQKDGAEYALTFVAWYAVAPASPPRNFDPTNPADRAYNEDAWEVTDRFVRDVYRQGMTPILAVARAPTWAEGANRPADAKPGVWKPDPGQFGLFAKAVATRYSGSFKPPGAQAPLPQVRYFQAWTEPNLAGHILPQWQGKEPASPERYRRLLNSFYDGIKSVSKRSRVLTAGLTAYGDDAGSSRVRPLEFWREIFCLKGRKKLKPERCPAKAKFDILAHNAINTRAPWTEAIDPDDAGAADLPDLQRVMRKAVRSKQVRPKGEKPLWLTEFWWQTDPPVDDFFYAISPKRQAEYVSAAMYLFWKAGARVAVHAQIRDSGSGDFLGTGVYFVDGSPKPAARAFRFPFYAKQVGRKGKVLTWGKAPRQGRVLIQRRKGKRWVRVTALRAGKSRIFSKRLRLSGKPTLRAQTADQASLSWKVGRGG